MNNEEKSKYLQEALAKRGHTYRKDGGEPVFGPPSPTAEALGQHYVRTADPFVCDTRLAVFGTPEPPFQGDTAAADAWRNQHTDRKVKAWAKREQLAPEDWIFEKATEELERVTGFDRIAVYAWLLTGVEPQLPSFVITPQHHALLGNELRTRRVQITLHVPLEPKQKKAIWDKLRGQWEHADFKRGFIELPQRVRYRMKERNQAVLDLCSRTAGSWKHRADEWNRTMSGPSFTADGIRHHHKRAQNKLNDLARLEATQTTKHTKG